MRRHHLFFFGFAILLAAGIAACGGGGGAPGAIPGTVNGMARTSATVSVLIPKSSGSTTVRKPAYVSPSTASISISVYTVNGATPNPSPPPTTINISSSSDCTTGVNGTSCTISVTVPIATSVVLQISLYDASGNLLGQSTIGPINTTLANIPTQSVSVGGVPATIVLSPAGLAAGDDGSTHALTFTVTAKDASGNTILPPGNYPNPIALVISGDPNGALSLSTASVPSPGPSDGATTVTLDYNSGKTITQATITASSGSVTASVPFAPIVFTPSSPLPLALYVGGATQTVTLSEAGYGGAFNVIGGSSVATVTCALANCTPASAGGSITISIAPGGVGSETVSAVDSNGGIANIPLTVTASGGGGEVVGPPYKIYEYATQPSGKNFGITVGPDGQTLWFVDQSKVAIGSVTNPGSCSAACGGINAEQPAPFSSSSPPPAALENIAAASDGNLYVTDPGDNAADLGNLFQLTCSSATSCTSNTYIYYAIYDDSAPNLTDVVPGPDGNLYISAASDISDDSAIAWDPILGCCTSYPRDIYVAGQPSAINMMTFDASGQTLWFTDQGNANVGFVAGLPCEVSCTAIEQPAGSSYLNGGIARRPPSRIASRFAVAPRRAIMPRHRALIGPQSAFTGPLEGIVAAPDGNIYVADAGNHTIDQIIPSTWESCSGTGCTFTAIALPNASAAPQNLTVGRDGNVWFTDTSGYVGFIALNTCVSGGTCKAYEYNVGGAPWGIVSGPDGDIWFTDSARAFVGKVVL